MLCLVLLWRAYCARTCVVLPNLTSLEIDWRTRENSGSNALSRLAAVHDALGDGREVAGSFIS